MRTSSTHTRTCGASTSGTHATRMNTNTSSLARLYSIIRKNTTANHDVLAELRDAMKHVTLEELGIEHSTPRGGMTYLHMYEDEHVSLGIFCLPAQSRIPLHDHPGMSVVSKVLYGDLHVLSFDWAQSKDGLATSVFDGVVKGGDAPSVLLPESGGNIHQFTALTDCAVLDLLSPPYSTQHGRDCTYYKIDRILLDGRAVLVEYEPPSSFCIQSEPYTGLQFHDHGEVSGDSTHTVTCCGDDDEDIILDNF